MLINLNQLRGKLEDRGQGVSLEDIAEATGISRNTLTEISKGRMKILRPEYIDALCTYFGVQVGELLEAEAIDLPINLVLRPDRRGARVGQRTKAQ